jgi:hypothetical protein
MKFMLLQAYGGVKADVPPMGKWTPEEIEAHIAYQRDPESKELLAGDWIVDVESPERALEIAARGSAAPGPGGAPIEQEIEVREVMSAPGIKG